MKLKEYLLVLIISCAIASSAYSQTRSIQIVQANSLKYDRITAPNLRKLIGDVILKHKGALMYCDSAYFYASRNMFEAFSNVHINQGDTTHLYADFINYTGDNEFTKARDNVRLENKNTTLFTDFLDYNTATNSGNYQKGGRILSDETTVTSIKGDYNGETNDFFFKDSVFVDNPDYKIYADTLLYNTETEMVYFQGPTDIISDTTSMYCEDGWYDSQNDHAEFKKNAYLNNKKQTLQAQRLYYEKNTGYGEAEDDIELVDSTRNVILKGHTAFFNRHKEYMHITDDALLISIHEGDSLFLHADTLETEITDTITGNRIFRAFYRAKFFRNDIQGQCDSLVYNSQDSIIKLYKEPVLWSGDNQLTAEYMEGYIKNEVFDKVYMESHAMIISIEDSAKFNQIKGKEITGFFKDNELHKLDANGNAESIYFPKEKQDIIGMNKVESSTITIFIENNQINNIIFRQKPSSVLSPLKDVGRADMFFPGFKWLEQHRPLSSRDVFIWKSE